MNFALIAFAAVATAASTPAFASPDLAQKKNCMGCHAVDTRLLGPAFKDVATKYAKDPQAAKMLADKIIKGGSGNWGAVPMPANPKVTPAEAEALAKWILTVK